ncbi:hypothetical protein [Hydrogenovibrio marinus]|uniref:Uncharacterized protein n=1 Tax=Hydrogenovibrio marinus TaxID=28885 RepID=A0A066ZQU0_HYDMR|nr:hypothetical protein [Hydrogenovibrio marinus]KDN94629.1 hypothetical protein EI16_12050 [Hydrogenovibrio marinus]
MGHTKIWDRTFDVAFLRKKLIAQRSPNHDFCSSMHKRHVYKRCYSIEFERAMRVGKNPVDRIRDEQVPF